MQIQILSSINFEIYDNLSEKKILHGLGAPQLKTCTASKRVREISLLSVSSPEYRRLNI